MWQKIHGSRKLITNRIIHIIKVIQLGNWGEIICNFEGYILEMFATKDFDILLYMVQIYPYV